MSVPTIDPRRALIAALATSLFLAAPASAGEIAGVSNVFVAGETARAAEVNQNFDEIVAEVDDNASDIEALGAANLQNASDVDALDTRLKEAEQDIDVLEADDDASTLGGRRANELLGAFYGEDRGSINDFAETGFVSVVDATAHVPANGFLMIWATLNAEYDFSSEGDANVDLECQISINDAVVSIRVDQEFAAVAGGTNSGESVAIATVAEVAKGDRVVSLDCRTTGAGMVFMKARSIAVLYTAFGSVPGTVSPASAAQAARSDELDTEDNGDWE